MDIILLPLSKIQTRVMLNGNDTNMHRFIVSSFTFTSCRLGSNPPDMSPPCPAEENSNHSYNTHTVVGRSGQILWIRGLTRLQTQVGQTRRPPLPTWGGPNRFLCIGQPQPPPPSLSSKQKLPSEPICCSFTLLLPTVEAFAIRFVGAWILDGVTSLEWIFEWDFQIIH